MTVLSTPMDTVMVVRYQIGIVNGSPVIRQKSLAGIKTSVSDADIYEVATALLGLTQYPLISVYRENHFDLIEE